MARTAVAHFHDRASADAAYDDLVQRGVSAADISIMGRGAEGKAGLADRDAGDVTVGEGAAIGGIAGLLLGAAALLIPGIGPVVAIGPLGAALASVVGGVAGATVGGIAGALANEGVEENTARYYEERFREGGVLVAVRTDDVGYSELRAVLERHGGDVRGDAAAADVAGPTTPIQSRGASPGAQDYPETRPRVGDDPGLIDTAARTRSGLTDSVGADLDPNRSTTPTVDVRRPGEPPDVPRAGGPTNG